MNLQVKKGDILFVENHTRIGRFINWGQRLLSSDGKARYNHCGIIRSEDGAPQTLEALKRVETHYLVKKYQGTHALIARPLVSMEIKSSIVDRIVNAHYGQKYPWYRFFILVVPYLAKYVDHGASVCSELTAKYLFYIGTRHEYYQGTTPDKLVDEVRHWREYEIIFEGILN